MQPELFALHAELEETHWWFTARRKIMRRLVHRILKPSAGRIVVDVGCGTGANISSLAHEYSCTGIDTSADAIALARRRYPNVPFIHGTAPEALGPTALAADLFLSMDVLEHIEDDFHAFSTLLAAAKPGAAFFITVPADMALWSSHDEVFGHYRRYDSQRLRALWAGLPVSTLLLSHFNVRLYPLIRAVRTVSRLRGASFGRRGSDLRMPPSIANRALERVFAGEAARLERVLEGGAAPYAKGTSLLAILRREPGVAPTRTTGARAAT